MSDPGRNNPQRRHQHGGGQQHGHGDSHFGHGHHGHGHMSANDEILSLMHEYAREVLTAKIKHARNLGELLAKEEDATARQALRRELNDVFLNDADIDSLDSKLKKLLAVLSTGVDSFILMKMRLAGAVRGISGH